MRFPEHSSKACTDRDKSTRLPGSGRRNSPARSSDSSVDSHSSGALPMEVAAEAQRAFATKNITDTVDLGIG
jgi:hypothetical protein